MYTTILRYILSFFFLSIFSILTSSVDSKVRISLYRETMFLYCTYDNEVLHLNLFSFLFFPSSQRTFGTVTIFIYVLFYIVYIRLL